MVDISRFTAPTLSAPKGKYKFEISLIKIFILKQMG